MFTVVPTIIDGDLQMFSDGYVLYDIMSDFFYKFYEKSQNVR